MTRSPPNNARLFGEVNASVLGSSGVIPEEHLNLPISDPASQNGAYQREVYHNMSSISVDTGIEPVQPSASTEGLNFLHPNASNVTTEHEFEQSAVIGSGAAAPSLQGAESMVGQMA